MNFTKSICLSGKALAIGRGKVWTAARHTNCTPQNRRLQAAKIDVTTYLRCNPTAGKLFWLDSRL